MASSVPQDLACLEMHRQGYTYDRGIYYVAISWVTTIIAVAAVSIRLYSRAFLTRSIGSDDFAILISAVCIILSLFSSLFTNIIRL